MTLKRLENKVKSLNLLRGFKTKTMEFNEVEGQFVSNPDVYYIGRAYGGYRLEQIANKWGGCRDITPRTTKKELYELIDMMVYGYNLAQRDSLNKTKRSN